MQVLDQRYHIRKVENKADTGRLNIASFDADVHNRMSSILFQSIVTMSVRGGRGALLELEEPSIGGCFNLSRTWAYIYNCKGSQKNIALD